MNNTELGLNKVFWLSVGIVLAGLPHWQRLPIWIPVVHFCLIVIRVYVPYQFSSLWNQKSSLINIIRLLVMFGGVLGIYSSYGTLAGRDVGVALLILLAGLKIFESKQQRDFYISTYLGYFLVITNFFYSQTIPTAVYMFFVIVVMTASLIDYNDTEEQLDIINRFKLSTSLLLQALPILLVLFILFPRINGPLWGLPKDAFTGITGIDDQMSPGTISKLVQSKEVAFRVSFEDAIPDQSRLYWRGPVLWHTDGRKWTTGETRSESIQETIVFTNKQINYDVIIEPTNKKWLFGLEMVSEVPKKTFLTKDHQLKTIAPIRSRKAFSLSSFINFKLGAETKTNFERGLQLPENLHPRTRELGSKLANQYKEPKKIIQATLAWFNEEDFIYTLKPPLITGDTVDEFLFNSREGFCEHYAAAFTVIMRTAGIPARVVTGYQGGELNPVGDYLIIRQYHAHAWTEVWLEGEGWIRIDPTSAISPARVNDGIENALPDAIAKNPLGLNRNSTAAQLLLSLRNTVDMVNYQWAQWILGYGPDKQKLLLKKIGLDSDNWKKITFLLIVILGIIVAFIAVFIFKNTPTAKEPAKIYYDRFCNKLAKLGLSRYSFEGPYDFAKRVSLNRQDISKDVMMISAQYVAIRYQSQNEKLKDFQKQVRSFTAKKLSAA